MFTGKAVGFGAAANKARRVARKLEVKKIALREAERLRILVIEQFNEQEPKTRTFGDWPPWKPLTKPERELEGVGGTAMMIRTAATRNAVAVVPTKDGAWVGVRRKAGRRRKRGVAKPRKQRRPRETGRKDTRKLETRKVLAKLARMMAGRDTKKKKPGTGKTAKAMKGRNIADVAATMEYGTKGAVAVKITPAMRRFLFGVLFKKAASAGKVSGKKKGFVVYSIPARPFLRPAAEMWERTLEASVGQLLDSVLAGP